jgi:hypothetical protein
MRLERVALIAFAASAALLSGCQEPDVGQRCDIQWNSEWQTDPTKLKPPTPETVPGDYLETGNSACDSLVCIVSPADSGEYATCAGGEYEQCGYCSKPCVSDAECYESETGLVCRQMVLDPEFIALLEETDPLLAEKYLGDARYSRYCAVPLD